jgi:hypothetical protein
MKYAIIFALLCILSCSKKSITFVEKDEEIIIIKRFQSDSLPQAIKNEIKNIKCASLECDKLLVCYGQYFKFLYGNMDIPLKIDLLECALKVAESNNSNGQNLILDYYGSKNNPKDGGVPDWAKRLRGEDAFEITLEYMRQSKGVTPDDYALNRAARIFLDVIPHMLIFKDGSNAFVFYGREKGKNSITGSGMEQEIWVTTTFIDILKNEIKEGRVVFKKYGE